MPQANHLAEGVRKIDPKKFENALQLGGICTGTLDSPGAGGGAGSRVAWVDTGSGLRFVVALDRGGDIVNASYNQYGLAYLSPNGLRPPSHSYHIGSEWLRNWAGGLVTTCGPEYIGGARTEAGGQTSLHGRFSNSAAVVESLSNPDPQRERYDMQLALVIRDTRVFGPIFEIRRTLSCKLGRAEILIEDEVTNRGDVRAPHNWLYHCNLGYPLLDEDARFVYCGQAEYWVFPPPNGLSIIQPLDAETMNKLKRVPAALAEHAGSGERGLIVTSEPGADGMCRIGLINDRLGIGLEFKFPPGALPRMAHWQHYGPSGSYVSALEPFYGSLLGRHLDRHPLVDAALEPGETRHYRMLIRVLQNEADLKDLTAADGPLRPHT